MLEFYPVGDSSSGAIPLMPSHFSDSIKREPNKNDRFGLAKKGQNETNGIVEEGDLLDENETPSALSKKDSQGDLNPIEDT